MNEDDDFLKPSPSHALSLQNQIDFGLKMDRMVMQLRNEIIGQSNFGLGFGIDDNKGLGGGLNLDIDLINDTQFPAPLSSRQSFKFPDTQTNFNLKYGDNSMSPSSSYFLRKKI